MTSYYIIKMVNEMYDYIKGIVKDINPGYVTLDNNGIGYKINTPNPYSFKDEEETTIYIYTKVSEDEYSLYGFKTKEEREIFLKLINVKGLGPKMALPILASSTVEGLMAAIESENILYLTKFPKIGDKLARQIVLDLKGKINALSKDETPINDELSGVLENLGYKKPEIKKIIKDVDQSLPLEEQIKVALKLLLK